MDDHLRQGRLGRRLVFLEGAQWSRATLAFGEDDLVDLARKVELQLPLRAFSIEGQKLPVQRRGWLARICGASERSIYMLEDLGRTSARRACDLRGFAFRFRRPAGRCLRWS